MNDTFFRSRILQLIEASGMLYIGIAHIFYWECAHSLHLPFPMSPSPAGYGLLKSPFLPGENAVSSPALRSDRLSLQPHILSEMNDGRSLPDPDWRSHLCGLLSAYSGYG